MIEGPPASASRWTTAVPSRSVRATMNAKRSGPSSFALASLLLAVSACGGPPPEGPPAAGPPSPPEAAPAPAAAAPAKPSAEAKAEAPPAAAPASSAKPVNDADGPDGVRRWASWDGPKTGAAITTKKAWVVAPNLGGSSDKDSFGAVALKLVDVAKADANEVVYESRGKKYATPAALARPPARPGAVKKGGVALCSFGGSSVVGLIEAADAKSVTCAFRFMEKTRKEKLTPEEVLPLDGKPDLGAPALVRFESDPDTWYEAMIVAATGDDVWASVSTQFSEGDPRAGRSVHKVKAAGAKVIDLSKPLKVGDPCLATSIATIEPCKVTKVIDGGVAYAVSFEGGGGGFRKEWELGTVAPAPKEAGKKK
jgi:hypothetical protein